MGGRGCNNIKSLGRKKSKGSVMATAVVMVIVMITKIKRATIVKAYGPPNGAGCLAPPGIAPRSVSASVAFDGPGIAVQHQYKHNPSVHRPVPRGASPILPLVMRSRRPTQW